MLNILENFIVFWYKSHILENDIWNLSLLYCFYIILFANNIISVYIVNNSRIKCMCKINVKVWHSNLRLFFKYFENIKKSIPLIYTCRSISSVCCHDTGSSTVKHPILKSMLIILLKIIYKNK